jgi:tagatose 1,6-diphosphate aldolase
MAVETATKRTETMKSFFLSMTPGKLSGLLHITSTEGRFKVFALDQSNSMKKAIKASFEKSGRQEEVGYEHIRDAKLNMVKEVSPYATAVLLDVNYGLRQAVQSGVVAKGVGMLARLEASRDAGTPGEVEPGWSVAQIKRMGASAVKLLVYMDTENASYTDAQMTFVKHTADDCRQHDILLLIEELSFPRQGEDKKTPAYLERKVKNIMASTQLLNPYADILKLEFPGESNLKTLTDMTAKPWVLLSAGEKYDLFVKQVEQAMKAGCSGIMAGRAVFNEYFEQPTLQAQEQFLRGTAVARFKELGNLVDKHASPWLEAAGLTWKDLAHAVNPTWYKLGKFINGQPGAVHGDY